MSHTKEDEVLTILNGLVSILEPFTYEEFNTKLAPIKESDLVKYEKSNPCLTLGYLIDGKAKIGSSNLAIMSTITEILTGRRIAAIVNSKHIVTGFCWQTSIDH